MAIKRVFQKEPVLSIAACLALVSSCFVLPDAEYLGYIDFRTLAILFSLMTVMAGLRGQGVFDRLGRALLSHTRTTLQLTAVLVGLCFFSSMVITNDVSLLTFVPFTFVVVNSLDAAVRDKLLLPIVCMQTIAANLGSMLTPLGNPQNLYLYGKSGMDIRALVIGTNLGGLGTLIASMASLISYREIARELPLQKGRYFALFTVSNILFVTVLMGAWALAG